MRKTLTDPSIWILLAVNAWCIVFYMQHPESFTTLLWLYWLQSVLIGLFHFFDLLTVKSLDVGSLTINGRPVENNGQSKGCASVFFLFHYQFFHLVYAIFIFVGNHGPVDFRFILISAVILTLELTLSLIRNKRLQQTQTVNYGLLFFLPYLRIIPMHLFILIPKFLGITPSLLFVLLKTLADIGMYLLSRKLYHQKAESGKTTDLRKPHQQQTGAGL